MLLITVSPLGEAWAVRTEGVANEMVFSSGSRAEASARALGERLAGEGQPARVHVFDRSGVLVGSFGCGR